MRKLFLAVFLISSVCLAQSAQAPATPAELRYLRFMLLNVASIDHDPKAVSNYETSLVMQFGLNTAESAVIHSAGQTLNPLLTSIRQSMQAAAPTSPSAATYGSLSSIRAQREQAIETLINQILNSVRPETAARLRSPGHIMANAAVKSN